MSCILCETGLGMSKRKAVYCQMSVRCNRCHKGFDKQIAHEEHDKGNTPYNNPETPDKPCCPYCGYLLKPAISHYVLVCTGCESIL